MTTSFSLRRIVATALFWVLAGMFLLSGWSRAQEPPATRRRMENRFLFVIDTSSAMKARTNGIQQAVTGLLASGMKGELRKGDTIGLWTYGERLDTAFPMRVWSEDNGEALIKQVRQHLRSLRYEKRSHLDKVLPIIGQVAAGSERLTIILVFDGADAIKGTPFDKEINALHKRFARDFRAAREPFVTLLTSRDGVFFDYTVNYPGAVMVPHTADPLPPPATNVPPPVMASAPPPPQIIPPPEAPKPPARKIEIILSGADFAHNASTPPPAASNVVTVPAPAPVPAPVNVTNAPAAAEAAPVVAQQANINVPPPEPERTPPPAVPAPPPAVSTPSPAVSTPSPAVSTPSPAVSAATPAVSTPAPAVSTPAPAVSAPVPAVSAPVPAPIVPAPAKPVPVAPAPPTTPAAVAAVVPPVAVPAAPAASTAQQVAMFIMAFSLLTIAVVLVLFLVRRWRGGQQPSLISQSIDRSR